MRASYFVLLAVTFLAMGCGKFGPTRGGGENRNEMARCTSDFKWELSSLDMHLRFAGNNKTEAHRYVDQFRARYSGVVCKEDTGAVIDVVQKMKEYSDNIDRR